MRLTANCLQFWEIAAAQIEPAAAARFTDFKSEWLHFREFRTDLRTSGERYFSNTGRLKHLRSMASSKKIRPIFETDLASPAENRPFLLPGSADSDFFIAVRNRAGRLFLTDAAGRKKWSFLTEGPLCSRPERLFFKAGGAPYFVFAEPKKIRPVSLEGKSPGGFPLNLPEGVRAENFSLIDYDGSGNYRLAVTDTAGGLHLFSKYGSAIKKWAPRDLSEPQAGNLRHLRIGTKDYLLSMSKKGQLNVLLRSGKSAPGFPMNFSHRPAGTAFCASRKINFGQLCGMDFGRRRACPGVAFGPGGFATNCRSAGRRSGIWCRSGRKRSEPGNFLCSTPRPFAVLRLGQPGTFPI